MCRFLHRWQADPGDIAVRSKCEYVWMYHSVLLRILCPPGSGSTNSWGLGSVVGDWQWRMLPVEARNRPLN